jgi:hypothetical protein
VCVWCVCERAADQPLMSDAFARIIDLFPNITLAFNGTSAWVNRYEKLCELKAVAASAVTMGVHPAAAHAAMMAMLDMDMPADISILLDIVAASAPAPSVPVAASGTAT